MSAAPDPISLAPDSMIEEALKLAGGPTDFGDPSFRTGLAHEESIEGCAIATVERLECERVAALPGKHQVFVGKGVGSKRHRRYRA